MHSIPISLLLLLILAVHVTTGSPSSDGCNKPFDCGPLRSLSHPFSGGSRPLHCGPPEFRLSCSDSGAEISIETLRYRILRINQTDQTMSLARSDLWDQTCPSQFRNTSIVGFFGLGAGNSDLTMFFRCNGSVLAVSPRNRFECDSGDAYFLVGPVPFDPILEIVRCEESVRVPILRSFAARLTRDRSLLGEALTEGFGVNYTVPFVGFCSRCVGFGGRCMFDSRSSGPVCFCGDRVCYVPESRNGNNKRVPMAVGLSIAGACIFGIFIGGLCYFIIRRRKKQAALTRSKDISTLPSSKSDTVPSTNYFRSAPSASSYSYSKSDVEKGSTYFGVQVFSYTELEEATNNFDSSKELGEGGFGTVYYGELRDGRVVAVKRLYENNFKRVEQFMNEVEILTRLQHKNLVKLYGCTSRRSRELLLVYEYISNGTVADHLHGDRSKTGPLSWPVRLSIAIETADALAYLHRTEIIHRDVKTNNILLDGEFRVKVADFGLSKLFPTDVTHVSTAPQGTPGYVDPEYYQCYHLTTKSDVYSFGVVLIELISSLQAVDTSRHRHDINLANMAIIKIQNRSVDELVDQSLGFDKDENVKKMVTDMAELAFRCIQQERDLRPSMEEVLVSLKAIRGEEEEEEEEDRMAIQIAEVVDIGSEDVGLLRNLPPPLSPDSVATDKWISNSD